MLEPYMRELEGELARRVASDDLRARLVETEAHLREGVEGRIELGLDRESAEREAVTAFGAARTVAKAVQRAALAPRDAMRLRLLGAAYTFLIVGLVGGPTLQEEARAAYYAAFALGWLALLGFAVASFRARRPAPVPVFATGVAAVVLFSVIVGTTWLNLYAFGGGGVVPIGQADRQVRELREIVKERTAARRAYDAGWRALKKDVEGLRTAAGYRVPRLRQDPETGGHLAFGTVANPVTARWAWEDFRSQSLYHLDSTQETQNLSAISLAQADRLGNFLSPMPDVIAVSTMAAVAAIGIDLVFGGLGALAFGLRRRSRGGGIVV